MELNCFVCDVTTGEASFSLWLHEFAFCRVDCVSRTERATVQGGEREID